MKATNDHRPPTTDHRPPAGLSQSSAGGRSSAATPHSALRTPHSKALRVVMAGGGTGGYVSAGVVLAAALQRIPTLIHEQNSFPGRTNRLLARFVDRVALTFPEAARFFPASKSVLTGLPIRPEIGRVDRAAGQAALG